MENNFKDKKARRESNTKTLLVVTKRSVLGEDPNRRNLTLEMRKLWLGTYMDSSSGWAITNKTFLFRNALPEKTREMRKRRNWGETKKEALPLLCVKWLPKGMRGRRRTLQRETIHRKTREAIMRMKAINNNCWMNQLWHKRNAVKSKCFKMPKYSSFLLFNHAFL